jgi:drug/metabolite transporter (DMT)-like permease
MDDSSPRPAPPRPALVAGFAALYLIWGSTYLGIKFAVESLPPFLMAGWRFVGAGLVLYLVLRFQGVRASGAHWGAAVVSGALLLLGGNGLVTWGQQQGVPSGIAALIVATTPLWMVLVEWLCYQGARPRWRVVCGLLAGFAGAVLLINPATLNTPDRPLLATLAILGAPVLWSYGSLLSRSQPHSAAPLLTSALQMIAGGGLMVLGGTLLGEWPQLAERAVSPRSALAFAYLTLIGSLVGFTTYTWLLRVASPTAVATYAYVNPLVAVFLGWLLGSEALQSSTLYAAVLIAGAVALITRRRAADDLQPRGGQQVMRQITPHSLWLGHAGDARDLRRVQDAGIAAVVDLALNEPPAVLSRELIYCRFPLVDGEGNDPELLRLAVETAATLLRSRTPTLICCANGMSRTPSIAACALADVTGDSPEAALTYLGQFGASDVSPALWREVRAAITRPPTA